MLIRVNEYEVINTKDIKRIEKSVVGGNWSIYTYDDSNYDLDTLWCGIDELIMVCNGDV